MSAYRQMAECTAGIFVMDTKGEEYENPARREADSASVRLEILWDLYPVALVIHVKILATSCINVIILMHKWILSMKKCMRKQGNCENVGNNDQRIRRKRIPTMRNV